MCGIAGILSTRSEPIEAVEAEVRAMCAAIEARGPDDSGFWAEPDQGLVLGHRRLSILDLSPLGHQPMSSADGRWVTAYNGEIYNYVDLRDELAALGRRFRGGSDTEVLLEAVSEWGPVEAFRRFNGMFALALWDRQERVLYLARDRAGKKPLYYGWVGGRLLFASTTEALRRVEGFSAALDREALAYYLRFCATPGPRTIHVGIAKVEPGGVRIFRFGGRAAGARPRGELARYFSMAEMVREGAAARRAGTPEKHALIHELDALLRDATRIRMRSDVPLGAFLSGGTDSTLVVALMQAQSARPVQTFSIGFAEADYDEAPHARAVAAHLGTEHTELYVTAEEAREVIPKLPSIFDEPFSDSSQIPTFLVAELARRHVTVALSGDGGDELFGGYHRYAFTERLRGRLELLPPPLRRALAAGLGEPGSRRLRLLTAAAERASRGLLGGPLGAPIGRLFDRHRLLLLAHLLRAKDADVFYRAAFSTFRTDRPLVLGRSGPLLPPMAGREEPLPELQSAAEMGSYLDAIGYLPDDILVKVDRATMAVSLEARAPLLDHRVMRWAWRLPYATKTLDGDGKWPLRTLLYRYVPRALLERPKQGFGVPVGEWIRGPLRGWAEDLLTEERLRRDGLLDVEEVRRRWLEHRDGVRMWTPEIWAVLMLHAWLDHTRA